MLIKSKNILCALVIFFAVMNPLKALTAINYYMEKFLTAMLITQTLISIIKLCVFETVNCRFLSEYVPDYSQKLNNSSLIHNPPIH